MRLLHVSVEGSEPYKNKTLDLDFFADDQVRSYGPGSGITRLGPEGSSVYSQNVVCLTGVNATGKTTALRLLNFVVTMLTDSIVLPLRSYNLPTCENQLSIVTIFESQGRFYLLNSQLQRVASPDLRGAFAITAETVWALPAKHTPLRTQLRNPESFKKAATIVKRREARPIELKNSDSAEARTYLPEGVLPLLSPYVSIVNALATEDPNGYAATTLEIDPPNPQSALFLPTTFDEPDTMASIVEPILHVFDDSIEHYFLDSDKRTHIRFAGEKTDRILPSDEAQNLLSSGTRRGSRMVTNALNALRSGGYLLVDEIENSINKELVRMIVNLFISRKTNPYGATLIFTTHYPELLDLLNRKDNIYFLRRDPSGTGPNRVEAVKYSSAVKRGELKRSEVFQSNFIGGTAPKAVNLKAVRDYVASEVNRTGGGHEKPAK